MAALVQSKSLSFAGVRGRPARARAVVTTPRAALVTDVRPVNRKAPKAGFELGFTKDNELFVSRLAMLGFGASVIGEVLSGGSGALAQASYLLGLPEAAVGGGLAAAAGVSALVGLLPNSATYSPEEVAARAAEVGPIQDPRITLLQPRAFFGLSSDGWGFSAENERFVGRVAQLGFAASLLGELATGLGPLHQLSAEVGVPVANLQWGLVMWATFMACTAVDKLAVKRRGGTTAGGKATSGSTKQTVGGSGKVAAGEA